MSFFKKVLIVSLTLASAFISGSLFASHRQDLCELEKRYPTYFRGFSKTDMDLIDFYRSGEKILEPNTALVSKFEKLKEQLDGIDNPALTDLKKELAQFIGDEKKHTLLHYIFSVAQAAIFTSDKSDIENQFFRLAGFSMPYSLINIAKPEGDLWRALLSWKRKHDDRGDFTHRTYCQFSDRVDQISDSLRKGLFNSVPYFLLCTESKEDFFGFFYLAWTYSQGIHPVPVTLKPGDERVHGIPMTPWGKLCHDLAHSKIDTGDHSVEQFVNNILNFYLTKLKDNLKTLSIEQKKQYGVKNMIPYVTEFALSVYNAYRESTLAILERSLKVMKVGEEEKLPELFKAFAAGAFLQSHETPVDLSARFATSSLPEILRSSVQPILSLLDESLKKDEGIEEKKSTSVVKADLLSTSFTTGETPLSDEEIFEIIKKRPIREYNLDWYPFDASSPIKEEEISEYSVKRNQFYIEVTIHMMDGQDYVYRAETNYSRRLNLDHDRQFLLPAKSILKDRYKYSIPKVPSEEAFAGNPESFESAVGECRAVLDLGRRHLLDFFLKTAIDLSQEESEDKATIADRYAIRYSRAISKLQKTMPPFIENIQSFLSEAMTQTISGTK